jgi:recombination protein RecR
MTLPSNLIENAISAFAKLPGVGKKTALRLVLHLLKQEQDSVTQFTEAIYKMRTQVQFCTTCNNVSDTNTCNICASSTRQKNVICVVENIRDLIAIESTQYFNGVYHVIGGLISPIDGIGPEQLHIQSLLSRVEEGSVEELIMALSPNIQGDTTSYYIQKKIVKSNIKITTISRGVAFGGELEYTDQMTLARSIQNRLPVSSFVQ